MSEFSSLNKVSPTDNNIEKIEKENTFTREAMIMECQFCQKRILTDIEHESTWIGIGASVILFFIFKIFSLPLIFLLIPLTQRTTHKCTNCLNTVGTHSFYDLLSLTDKIISFKVGNFAIIFTRKQLLGTFVFILFTIITYLFLSNSDFSRGNFIKSEWNDYKRYCSMQEFEKNHNVAEIYCKNKFKYSDVSWKGYVIRVDYDDNFFARYIVSLLIKMEVNAFEDPDLYLKFDTHYYSQYKDDILNITRGDYVSFNSTFIFEGNKRAIPVLEGFGIAKLDNHIFINPHIHSTGRYGAAHGHVNKDDKLFNEVNDVVLDEDLDLNGHETSH